MNDPDVYSRRTTRRLRLIAFVFTAGYVVSAASLFPLCSPLVDVLGLFAPMTMAGGGAFLPAVGLALVAHHAHKSRWPEHPDEEDD